MLIANLTVCIDATDKQIDYMAEELQPGNGILSYCTHDGMQLVKLIMMDCNNQTTNKTYLTDTPLAEILADIDEFYGIMDADQL